MCTDPAMCMLMTVVVCVCKLGDEYDCGSVCVWVSREVGVCCHDNLSDGFSFLT